VSEVDPAASAHQVAFEAFGVRLSVLTSDTEALDMVLGILPPGWEECSAEGIEPRFAVLRELAGTYTLSRDGDALHQGVELDLIVGLLDTQLRSELSRRAPDRVFVHAGAVAQGGRVALLPGGSFAGKTTLTAALVRLGAVYYSDEFAVLDDDGLVHPYPRGLSLRDNGRMQRADTPVERLGGVAGSEPLPVGLVVLTEYRPGGEWSPTRLSPGRGALALLPHTMPARARPGPSLHALARAMSRDPVILQSDRGEADEVAPLILAQLTR
jgi:hypothetical protein